MRVNKKIRGIYPLQNLFKVIPTFHRLLRSSPLGHSWQQCPMRLLGRRRWKLVGVTVNIFSGQIPRIFGLTILYVKIFQYYKCTIFLVKLQLLDKSFHFKVAFMWKSQLTSPVSAPPSTKFRWLILSLSIHLTTLAVASNIASKDRISRSVLTLAICMSLLRLSYSKSTNKKNNSILKSYFKSTVTSIRLIQSMGRSLRNYYFYPHKFRA
jgi:hypothetical protein